MTDAGTSSNSAYIAICFADEKDYGNDLSKYFSKINFILAAVINSLIACCGAVLNITFIITVLKIKSLQTPPNIILVGLAINDCITSVLIIPFRVYYQVLLSQGTLQSNLVDFVVLSILSSSSVSRLLVIAISIEKYIAVCFPFWYERNVTKTKTTLLCFVSAVSNLLLLFICIGIKKLTVLTTFVSAANVITHLIFMWCQTKVFLTLSKIKRRIRTEQTVSTGDFRKHEKNSFTLLFIGLSFLVSYLPVTVFSLYNSIFGCNKFIYQYVLPWITVLLFMSTVLSPITYYWRVSEIREKAAELFLKQRA